MMMLNNDVIITTIHDVQQNATIKMSNETRALLWQSFFAITMFVSLFVSYLIPIIIFSRRNRRLLDPDFTGEDLHMPHHWSNIDLANQLKKYRLKRLLSYCNCVSGGVFLGVCFLNLIPSVENEFDKLLKDFDSLKSIIGTFPLGQFTVICGLFFVLILETLLSKCFKHHPEDDAHDHSHSSTVPILYLDDETNETRNDLHDEQIYDQEELLLSNEVNVRKTNEKCSNGIHNGINGERKRNRIVSSNDREILFSEDQHNHRHGHGHSHLTADEFRNRSDSMLSFFILMFATSIHSLFEGLALGLQSDISNAIHLFIGIIIHECLVAIALGLNAVRLQPQNINLWLHVRFAFLFSMTIPVGNILGILLGYTPGHVGRFISAIFQGFAAGTFIHVTFLELIPEELLSNDCDTKEDELEKIINDQTMMVDSLASGATDVGIESETSGSLTNNRNGINQSNNHLRSNHQSTEPQSISSNGSNLKLRKILLLLLGFFIMTLVPFIFRE